MSNWSVVSFKATVYLLVFCLYDLSIDVSGVLKSPTITVLLLICPVMAVGICLLYWGAPMVDVYIFTIVISSYWVDPVIIMYCLSLPLVTVFKVCFVWYKYCYPSFLIVSICLKYLFPSPHFQSVCVFSTEVSLL